MTWNCLVKIIQQPNKLSPIFFLTKGTVSLARIWCFLPFSAMIVRALQERLYEKNRGNYLTYEPSLQSYDTHVSTYKWLSLIRWLMYRNDIILTSFHLFQGSSLIYANMWDISVWMYDCFFLAIYTIPQPLPCVHDMATINHHFVSWKNVK